MKDLCIGLHVVGRDARSCVDRIVAAEEAGVDVAWMTSGGLAVDPLLVFALAADRTNRIELGTCIIPTFPRHPLALAGQAAVVDSLAPGRFRLGVGPSHKPAVEATYGLPFERPLEHLREYVQILNAILKEGKVSFHGKRLHAQAQLPAPTQVRVMVSALRQNAFRLAGELADGGISWVTPLRHIRDVAVPAVRAGAAAAGREPPPIVVHVPFVVSTDREAVRAAALRQLGFYPRLPFYSAMFQDSGYPEAKDGRFSERMADELVIWGDEDEVEGRVRELPEHGAGEMIATLITLESDPEAEARSVKALGKLAKAH
jgi:F420-dependent oxidoreductase-like protein